MMMSTKGKDAERVSTKDLNDHKILNAAIQLQEKKKGKVTLVSKDINLRLKAKALNLPAEDFKTGKVKDKRHLYTGKTLLENVDSDVIQKMYRAGSTTKNNRAGRSANEQSFLHPTKLVTLRLWAISMKTVV